MSNAQVVRKIPGPKKTLKPPAKCTSNPVGFTRVVAVLEEPQADAADDLDAPHG